MHNLFEGYGIFSNGILHVSPKEAVELCRKGALIVDVREEFMHSYKKFDVEKTIYLPSSELQEKYATLSKEAFLIFADATGLRSKEAVLFLQSCDYKTIANLAGGIVEWDRDSLPLKINLNERLSGPCPCQLKPPKKSVD